MITLKKYKIHLGQINIILMAAFTVLPTLSQASEILKSGKGVTCRLDKPDLSVSIQLSELSFQTENGVVYSSSANIDVSTDGSNKNLPHSGVDGTDSDFLSHSNFLKSDKSIFSENVDVSLNGTIVYNNQTQSDIIKVSTNKGQKSIKLTTSGIPGMIFDQMSAEMDLNKPFPEELKNVKITVALPTSSATNSPEKIAILVSDYTLNCKPFYNSYN